LNISAKTAIKLETALAFGELLKMKRGKLRDEKAHASILNVKRLNVE
jgi:hypothetical protein